MPIAYFHVLPVNSASKCIATSDYNIFLDYVLAENKVVLTQDSGFQIPSLSLPPQTGSVTPDGVTTNHLGTTSLDANCEMPAVAERLRRRSQRRAPAAALGWGILAGLPPHAKIKSADTGSAHSSKAPPAKNRPRIR